MRVGQVIGRTTVNVADPALRGGRFLLVQPLSRDQWKGLPLQPLATGSTVVVYDELGAGVGHVVGFTEGAEATAPFAHPIPIDAYNVAILDRLFYTPPSSGAAGTGP
jgi:carbon dioxide concentrating mechanism protein CcmL